MRPGDTGPDRGERWVQPHWFERQTDPRSPDVLVAPDGPQRNRTHRTWTVLGTLASAGRAAVDERGYVCTGDGSWGLDWWIGAGDRWRFPSREAGVRQSLVGGSPVVETILRVPGGEIVHRACGVRATAGDGDGAHVLVEIENRGPVAVVLALALRPTGLEGPGWIGEVVVDGTEVQVDGRRAVVLAKPPAQVALGDAGGDVADVVVAEAAENGASGAVRCGEGRAQAALLLPLPHTATARVALPLGPPPAPRRRGADVPPPVSVAALPATARVVAGWDLQADRGTRVSMPPGRLADAVAAARRSLLLAVSSEDLSSWPSGAFRFHDAALVLDAAGRWGFVDEVAAELATWGERQGLDGWFADHGARADANGAALWAVGQHWRMTRDPEVAAALLGPLAKGVHALEKRRGRRRREPLGAGSVRGGAGLVRGGAGPRWAGSGDGPVYADSFWAWAGAVAVADAMDGIGQPDVASGARSLAAALAGDLRAELGRVTVAPAGPSRRVDAGIVANLVACEPLGVLAPDDPLVAGTLDAIRDRFAVDGTAVLDATGPAGFDPVLTAWLAGAELVAGDPRALDRLAWLVAAASSTFAWPEVIHPRSGGGAVGEGHHTPATAAVLRLVRQLLARDTVAGPVLCSWLPEGWEGQGIEVHDAPTAHGLLSYALRWHGERPAVLWELDPHPGVEADAVELRAPGLDPAWIGTGARGEALLSPFARPAPVEPPEVAESPAAGEAPPAPSPASDGGSFS